MRTIYLYYEIFDNYIITDKDLGYDEYETFENVVDAENRAFELNENAWLIVDRDLLSESQFLYDGDDYELHSDNF